MLFLDFLRWWYGPGWLLRLKLIARHEKNWLEFFSVDILLRTMFQPWRQTITVARSDQALNAHFQAMVDNLVSRLVGFFVRSFALVAAAFTLVAVLIFNVITLILWPIWPMASVIIIAIGFMV